VEFRVNAKNTRSAHSRPRRAAAGSSGFTLVELTVAISVLVIALCATASTVVSTGSLNRQSHETELARKAAESMLDALRNAPFATVFAQYNSAAGDDPLGPGTAPGANFAVKGLTPVAGAPGGVAGRIIFPAAGPELRENVDDATLGMPRDLTGDGLLDGFDHAGDYRVLPVRVRVSWTGTNGARFVELQTLLSEI
jgi:prepilin-type N-terminal cleavage/methylation domain-containing protein